MPRLMKGNTKKW